MSSKNNNKKKKVVTRQMPAQATAQATLVTPISPFTDFTNFQIFLQQQQLHNSFMNSLTLNKANTEHEEISLLRSPIYTNNSQENSLPIILESTSNTSPIASGNLDKTSSIISDTLDNKTSSNDLNTLNKSTNRWTKAETRMLIEEVGINNQHYSE
ncbi:663_t:CDS:2 [Funneliformis geosporum]|uniref:663_t:CDS:1 n=1 Tax=Funneliformis geosporum TaxID=1117311 RepID=A0A9W4WUT0_9GLOM|nr:663_t:CDS:2 [Funneliformis geosporum]